jgi:hypothetical protein
MAQKETNLGLSFVIRYPDGRTEEIVVDTNRALIGSGGHCEIRLPAESAALEHVAVQLHGGGVHAAARSMDPPPTINGSAFAQTPVLPDSMIGVGRVQIWVSAVAITDNANVVKKTAQKTRPWIVILGAVAIPLLAYDVFYEPAAAEYAVAPPTAPPGLWRPAPDRCKAPPEQARAYAIEQRLFAEGKRERRPFHIQDGVNSVPMFEMASVCFKQSGDYNASNVAAQAAQALRVKVNEDYRAHQMRLEHALVVDDEATAEREVRVLKSFTEGQQGPYVTWLSNLGRQLQVRLGARTDG